MTKISLLVFMILQTTACMSSRVALNPDWQKRERPDYEDYFDQYLFGFVDGGAVQLQSVCLDEKPQAFEVARTTEDNTILFLTLGLYSPLTVRVWCGH